MPNDDSTIEVGDSFILRNEYGAHLHVVVADSSPNHLAQVMLVYISSKEKIPFKDPTTFIEIGEHPFVHMRSWVRYQNILIDSRHEINKLIVKRYGKINDDLLKRIQVGINSSDFVSGRNKKLYNEWDIDRVYRKINK